MTGVDPAPSYDGQALGVARGLLHALLPHLEQASAGAVTVDQDARISWINHSYARLLGATPERLVGRPIREIIPATRMPETVRTGQPKLLDVMEFRDQQFVVTRLPVVEQGRVVGGLGFVVYDDLQHLAPLMGKYRRLQEDLAVARRALARRTARYSLSDFVGASPAALEVKRRARLAAGRETPVMLLGETGTGKEILAQAIHSASARSERPFVGVNLAAVPENLLEAEFFGVAPGAYTGAGDRAREGKFQLAHRGTLFLDEIGDMPLALQAKLLRVLEEQEVEPLGSNTVQPVDVRVIAATSRDMDRMLAEGTFRSDLYYRLNVLEIRVPPLRERLQDLGVLCETLLEEIALGGELHAELAPGALDVLHRYHWPGNIRELRNALAQALTMNEGERALTADDLAAVLPLRPAAAEETAAGERPAAPVRPLAETVAAAEKAAIDSALQAARGNRSQAARMLGISRSVLYEKMTKLSGKNDI
ncbi:sigma 54-interacting transcriptional regulator [Aquisalimonas lutea]|uniref:sigma-54 interaction domain-containing protein n=1 Tax=Aquisalimonas lutea TaxID=1327750 RepID=UPI0025B5E3B7|nr:sigma 54-interacting transcriptional regulator [Aquisalimonas lutea]MDN3517437.1 sigma 54-interacting transcriptional regulator [Aquisalimonas lutea]